MGNYLIDSGYDNIQDMVLKTIKNRNIACLGLGYKLIFKLVRCAHKWSNGMMENVASGS
jgi:hypothetical protein